MESCSTQGNLCRCLDSAEAQNISARGNAHVHCQCAICEGRAAYPMTAWRHMQRERVAAIDEHQPLNGENVQSGDGDGNSGGDIHDSGGNINTDSGDTGSDDDEGGGYVDDCGESDDDDHGNIGGDPVDNGGGDPELPDLDEDEELDEDAVMKDFVLDAVLRLVEIKGEAGFSLKTLEELLIWGRNLHCANNEQLLPFWPSCWSEVQVFLENVGYKSPQLYWICLDESHPCLFGLMREKAELCIHCGKEGTIPYYYLSATDKVKRWCSSPTMCRNMTAHWREKSHWLPAQWKEGWGWPCKKEFWDGTRFSKLSYFWDPDTEWTLPAKCPENGCGIVISADELLSAPVANCDGVDTTRLVECPSCQNIFQHIPQQVRGDPRNIAYDCKFCHCFWH
jgi:hypothetical protein